MKAFLQLIHPELPISADICVIVGQTIALRKFLPLSDLVLGFGSGLFLSGSAMIFNDLFDLEVDRINTPEKPIPSGKVTPKEAIVFGILTGLIAMVLAILIAPWVLVLSLMLWILGFLYNWKLKANGLLGNLIVALNVAIIFIMGGISVGGLVKNSTSGLKMIFKRIQVQRNFTLWCIALGDESFTKFGKLRC